MEYSWGTSLHDGDVEESLRIKTPQWSRGEVLEEQVPLMGDMGSYFRKWRELRNSDLSSKSSTSIKEAENDEAKDNQTTNQSTNQITKSIDSMSINKS